MPASLQEAFSSPKIDSSVYTRSSLDSLKNLDYNGGGGYNSHITSGLSYHPINQSGGGNTVSLLDTLSNNTLSCEAESIRQKYSEENSNNDNMNNNDHINNDHMNNNDNNNLDKKCNEYVYHVLSCTKCRSRMKNLLEDSKEDDDLISIEDLKEFLAYKKNKTVKTDSETVTKVIEGFVSTYTDLFKPFQINNGLQSILILILIGVLIILISDYVKRLFS